MIAGKHISAGAHAAPKAPSSVRKAMVEFMPGRIAQVEVHAVNKMPKYALCRLVKTQAGSYLPVPQTWYGSVKLTETLHEELGLPCSYKTLYNLCIAGFILCTQPTPRAIYLDLASLMEHFRRTEVREGEPSWWTPERVRTYREARVRWSLPEDESEDKAPLAACPEDDFRLQ